MQILQLLHDLFALLDKLRLSLRVVLRWRGGLNLNRLLFKLFEFLDVGRVLADDVLNLRNIPMLVDKLDDVLTQHLVSKPDIVKAVLNLSIVGPLTELCNAHGLLSRVGYAKHVRRD